MSNEQWAFSLEDFIGWHFVAFFLCARTIHIQPNGKRFIHQAFWVFVTNFIGEFALILSHWIYYSDEKSLKCIANWFGRSTSENRRKSFPNANRSLAHLYHTTSVLRPAPTTMPITQFFNKEKLSHSIHISWSRIVRWTRVLSAVCHFEW